MFWLSVKAFFLKAWAWCKKYWQLLVGASIPLIVWILMRGRTERLKEALAKIRELHEREISAIEASKKQQIEAIRREAEEKERAARELLLRIREIEEKYNVSRENLDEKKRKELEKLLTDDVDSAEVSKRLADIFGIDIEP